MVDASHMIAMVDFKHVNTNIHTVRKLANIFTLMSQRTADIIVQLSSHFQTYLIVQLSKSSCTLFPTHIQYLYVTI